jgi:hypothetical protein
MNEWDKNELTAFNEWINGTNNEIQAVNEWMNEAKNEISAQNEWKFISIHSR